MIPLASQDDRARRGPCRRWLLLAFGLSLACGSTLRKSRDDLPLEDRGAAELTRMVLDYKEALSKRDFRLAERLLVALEREVGEADPVTQAHPDFEEISRAAKKARAALEATIRRADIDDLMRETNTDLDKGAVWAKNLAEKGPVPRLLDGLGQTAAHLAYLQQQGQPYRDDPRYAEFAQQVDTRLGQYQTLVSQYGWLARLHAAIAPALEQAIAEDQASQGPGELASRQAAAERATAGFTTCTTQAATFAADPAASPTLAWVTALGGATLPELQLNCEFRRAAADGRVKQLGWQVSVNAVATDVDLAIRALREADSAAARLLATSKAIDTLLLCQRRLAGTERQPGYDGSAELSTLLGRLTAVKLRAACGTENERLAEENPTRHWQSALESLRRRAREARAQLSAVTKLEPPSSAEPKLRAALAGLTECREQAEFLVKRKAPAWRKAKPKALELKEARNLDRQCRADEKQAKARLNKLAAAEGSKKKKKRGKRRR